MIRQRRLDLPGLAPVPAVALALLALSPAVPRPWAPAAVHAQEGAEPPAEPPARWGPGSINLEDVPYPHPVHHLEVTLYGQDARLAYMDVPPAGPANGRTVVLLHGLNFFGEYFHITWTGGLST